MVLIMKESVLFDVGTVLSLVCATLADIVTLIEIINMMSGTRSMTIG